MDKKLEALEEQVAGKRNFDSPPLHLWNPPLSGNIDIVIRSDGDWYHEGRVIRRPSIMRLFASILRREKDGDYYLVTPAEKWRIQVERFPLLVTDIESQGDSLAATLNTDKVVHVGEKHPLFLAEGIAAIELSHGLSALFTRAAWYRLVEMAEDIEGIPSVSSEGQTYPLTDGH